MRDNACNHLDQRERETDPTDANFCNAKVTSRLVGGLGNQMFQYACARALAHRHNTRLELDLSWYTNICDATERSFLLENFPALKRKHGLWSEATPQDAKMLQVLLLRQRLGKQRALSKELPSSMINEPHYAYWDGIEHVRPPIHLTGYWQNEKYFVKSKDVIVKDFAFPPLPAASQKVGDQIAASTASLSVHIRRGDYASNPATQSVHGLCPPQYYDTALGYITERTPECILFIFSDDPAWVREYFDLRGLPAIIVDAHGENGAHHDMHLMTLCKHHVLANSSFSWWGAWLGQHSGITVAPKQWFAETSRAHDNPCPPEWVLV